MATTASDYFPLATESPYTSNDGNAAGTVNSDGNGTPDNDAGAAGGSSSNSFNISTGGLIAIVLVVVVVALLGSKFTARVPSPRSKLRTLILHSWHGDTLLHRQEEGVEGPRGPSQISKESRYSSHTTAQRVPKVREGRVGEVGEVGEVGKVEGRRLQDGRGTAHAATEAGRS